MPVCGNALNAHEHKLEPHLSRYVERAAGSLIWFRDLKM